MEGGGDGEKGHARAKYKFRTELWGEKTIGKNVLLVSKTTLHHVL
jgi:hypothetical protein